MCRLYSIGKHSDAFGNKIFQKIMQWMLSCNSLLFKSILRLSTIPFLNTVWYHLSWRTASPWFMTSSFKRFWNAGQNGGKSESHPGQLKYPKYLLFVIFRMPNNSPEIYVVNISKERVNLKINQIDILINHIVTCFHQINHFPRYASQEIVPSKDHGIFETSKTVSNRSIHFWWTRHWRMILGGLSSEKVRFY